MLFEIYASAFHFPYNSEYSNTNKHVFISFHPMETSQMSRSLLSVCVCHLECKTIFMHLCVTTKSSGDMKIIILARNITACSPQSQRTDIHEKNGAQCNFHDIEPSRIYRNLWKIVIFAQAANSVLKIPANCFRYWAVSLVVTVASSKNISRYIIKSHT